jgi:hypothetical protein
MEVITTEHLLKATVTVDGTAHVTHVIAHVTVTAVTVMLLIML